MLVFIGLKLIASSWFEAGASACVTLRVSGCAVMPQVGMLLSSVFILSLLFLDSS